MVLVPGIPQPVEYPLEFKAQPRQIPAGRDVIFDFRVLDPKNGKPVRQFEIVHEKLFHLFVVSQDLEYFAHVHPEFRSDGWFRLTTKLPSRAPISCSPISTRPAVRRNWRRSCSQPRDISSRSRRRSRARRRT